MAQQIVRFSVAFHREELAELHAIASENGLPVGTVIRQCVRHFLLKPEPFTVPFLIPKSLQEVKS